MPIRIQDFRSVRIQMRIRIQTQTQGFDDQNVQKKIAITYLETPTKHVQSTGEAFCPQKRTSSTSKIFWVIFALLEPDLSGAETLASVFYHTFVPISKNLLSFYQFLTVRYVDLFTYY
jgi:hypothetical protein